MAENGEKQERLLERMEGLARTIVRPAVTLVLLVVASWMVISVVFVPEWYQTLVVAVISFWFGSRQNDNT